jgi:fumarate reductase iron-sulfur subunit
MLVQETDEFIDVHVWRGDSGGGNYVHYAVPAMASQTVLDVVTWIQRNVEPGLAYRFACRVGMCGSCAMMVNGRPRWTCRSHVQKVIDGNAITIAPLRNLPVIKDLACDLSNFFAKWRQAQGHFVPTITREQPVARISPQSPQRRAASAAIECINCAICHAACDVVAHDPRYLGPAALNRAWALINDVRDSGRRERLRAVSEEGGCQGCHSQQGCSSHCPNDLNPTRSIAGLKRAAAMAVLKGRS